MLEYGKHIQHPGRQYTITTQVWLLPTNLASIWSIPVLKFYMASDP